jgi:hypothetical protein
MQRVASKRTDHTPLSDYQLLMQIRKEVRDMFVDEAVVDPCSLLVVVALVCPRTLLQHS